MDIMQELTKALQDPRFLATVEKQTGLDAGKITATLGAGIPMILGQLNKTAQDGQGAQSLSKALDDHAGDDISNPAHFLEQFDSGEAQRMLGHIFGGNTEQIAATIGAKSGAQSSQVSGILSMAAPLLLASLGKQKASQPSGNLSDLTNQAVTALGGTGGVMDMVTKMLDADGDGSALDDIGNLVGKFLKR